MSITRTRIIGGLEQRLSWMGAAALLAATSCGGSVVIGSDAGTAGGGGAGPQGRANQVDLLLVIDNSRSMEDKQTILAATLPDLLRGLTNPACVDPSSPTDQTKWQVPATPLDACPAGLERRFAPVADLHVGVISSSLGGHGSDACPTTETTSCAGSENPSNNDAGHLLTRNGPCAGGVVPTYQGQGFLAWDPASTKAPPGETAFGQVAIDPTSGAVTTASPGLVASLADLVQGTGQIGCGFESQLESMYRFLMDPEPYGSLTIVDGKAVAKDLDPVLLTQRADFLRPSSLLLVVGLTDENDCSIREYGQFYFAAQTMDPAKPNKAIHLPRARSECAQDPGHKCCLSCGQNQGDCPFDPNCTTLPAGEDPPALRCWEQKRRFGIDFLYPLDRYLTGFTGSVLPNRTGEMVPNPIFSDLKPGDSDSSIRDQSLVYLAFIAGVPWQDLARDPHDLGKGYKTAAELSAKDASGHSTWDHVIGDPASYQPPLDPFMVESTQPRSGKNPFTFDSIAPPGLGQNPINGHEYTPGLSTGVAEDLQYACVFPLLVPRDCASNQHPACDCTDPTNDNPLCEPDPENGGNRTRQVRAKAYPSLRELAVIQGLGEQGIAASVCPAQLTDQGSPTYGYRPAFEAILERIGPALGAR